MSRTLTGVVVSDKADKTIVIAVQTRKTNRIYKKQYSVTTKFMAHDENNTAHVGDRVVIVETRPLSARKRFMLKEILETAKISFFSVSNSASLIRIAS
jgi:small subunit ribosomal protein S17